MKGSINLKRFLPIVLSILWLVLAVFLSLQNGSGTGALSRGSTKWLVDRLSRIGLNLNFTTLHAFLRVAAHFIVFFVLGMLFAWSLNAWGAIRIWHVLATLTAVTAIAVLVEVGKLRIPGRHLQWNEALLNVSGVWCGIGIWQIGSAIVRAIGGRRNGT